MPRPLIIKAPSPIPDDRPLVFLAGSIEMGNAPDWQARLARRLADLDVTILNPRRDDWDATWTQSIDNPQFREQVDWELDGLERADIIVMYFVPGTQSPISLMELGLIASYGNVLVCCPEGFWRKGNVDVLCERYGLPQLGSIDDVEQRLRAMLI